MISTRQAEPIDGFVHDAMLDPGRRKRVDKGSRRRHRGGRCVGLSVILHHPCKKMRPPGAGGNPTAFPQAVSGLYQYILILTFLWASHNLSRQKTTPNLNSCKRFRYHG